MVTTTATTMIMVMTMAALVTVVVLLVVLVMAMMMMMMASPAAALEAEAAEALEVEPELGRRSALAQVAGAATYSCGADAGRGASWRCPPSCRSGRGGITPMLACVMKGACSSPSKTMVRPGAVQEIYSAMVIKRAHGIFSAPKKRAGQGCRRAMGREESELKRGAGSSSGPAKRSPCTSPPRSGAKFWRTCPPAIINLFLSEFFCP